MAHLNKTTLDSSVALEKDLFLWDAALPGFGARLKPGGTKTFLIQYRNAAGRSRRLTIGRYGVLTLTQARDIAKRKLGEVAGGADPAAEKQRIRRGTTLHKFTERYMQEHCLYHCKESTIRAHKWLLKKFILPAFGARGILDIAKADILQFHRGLADTPYNANRALGLLRAMYNKAIEWGILSAHENPTASIKPFRERKRERFLSAVEVHSLFETMEEMRQSGEISDQVANAISLLVYTGCRLNEILTLKWGHIKFEQRTIFIDQHKTDHKGSKIIPLNPTALQLLKSIPVVPGNEFVIPGKNKGTHLVNLQKPWRKIRSKANLNDLRIHDLRHTFASIALNAGVPLAVVGGLLGHESSQSTARYAHLALQTLQQATNIVDSQFTGLKR